MRGNGDKRLIEDLIPVEAISVVAQREKTGHAALHPRKLHLWWARRPLAAARAAVYATLVPIEGTPEHERSDDFFVSLCQWGASDQTIAQARERVLAANGGMPPKVLDLFAGGGAIPLEAARLGCDATAVELNPVAHLIERCTLDYPQRFGPGLANDVREYGRRWVDRTWERVGRLYPRASASEGEQQRLGEDPVTDRAAGRPIAYLWTRTVPCPNTAGGAHDLPLVRQTWLAKKKGHHVALKPVVDRTARTLSWEVVVAPTAEALGFDPAGFSSRGKASCLVCGATVEAAEVKAQGLAGRMNITPLAAVIIKPSGRGRDYLAVGTYEQPSDEECEAVLAELSVAPPDELIPSEDTRNFWTPQYGLTRFRDLFTPRQLATLCAFAQGVREAHSDMIADGMEPQRAEAVCAYLALALDRTADRNANLCRWDTKNQSVTNVYARQALPMVWDFAEANPFGAGAGRASEYVENVASSVEALGGPGRRVECHRTSATQLPDHDGTFDAVITDPPYYDNISYADLSDFFYVWLKRSIGFLLEDEFSGELTPKRREAIMAPYRHAGDKRAARAFYEQEMAEAFAEAHRVLKPNAPLVCVPRVRVPRRPAHRGWGAAAAAFGIALAGCGDPEASESVIAKPVAPPNVPAKTRVPAVDAQVEPNDVEGMPAADEPPTMPASSTKRPSTSDGGSRPRILSVADLQSFRSLARSLTGAEGVAVSGSGFGQRVERVGSLRSAVAWSTSKVPVAMAVIAGGGAKVQQSNLTRAITASDNAAALQLWSSLGNSDQAATAADAQLRAGGDDRTNIESRNLRGDAYTPFGQTSWALTDQARFTAGMVCSSAGEHVLGLMGQVASEQRWGLASAEGSSALKGGWGPGSQPGIAGRYLDRQMGVITVRGKQLAVAIAAQPADGAHATGTSNLTAITHWLVAHADVTGVPAHPRC